MLPPERVLADWKADYETMLEQMIYEENAPSFDKLIVELKKLNDKINSLGWKFDFDFSIKK